MISYDQLKEKVGENRQKFLYSVCFILVFIVGFGTGRAEQAFRKPERRSQTNTNYTQSPPSKPAKTDEQATKTPAKGNCPIKGNVSATSKIYHVPGGAFYAKVTPEQCFNTEAEAKAAGFRKSSR